MSYSFKLIVTWFIRQFFQLDETTKGSKSKDEDDDIYSVPPEVLHSISKNFSELQQEFDKVFFSYAGKFSCFYQVSYYKTTLFRLGKRVVTSLWGVAVLSMSLTET